MITLIIKNMGEKSNFYCATFLNANKSKKLFSIGGGFIMARLE